MKLARKLLICIMVFSIGLFGAVFIESSTDFELVATTGYANEPIIIIDAGHGGFDGGAVASDGTVEKDLNLSVALYLADLCRANGLSVYTVRQDDSSLESDSNASIRNRKNSDLHNRMELMSRYENSIFISIHMNKFSDSSVHGAQIFYTENYDSAKVLASTTPSILASSLTILSA